MINEKKIDAIKNGKVVGLCDILFMAVLLVVAFLSVLYIFFGGDDGEYVVISYNNQSTSYNLNIDTTITLDCDITIVVKDGECYVECAECPDQVCVHSSSISKTNEIIVCAYEGVTITIVGESDLSGVVG